MVQEKYSPKFQNACSIWFCPADDKIAKELRKMPQEEREKVWADLSGNEKTSMFKKVVVEDVTQISESLNRLKREIDGIKEKPAFEKAEAQSPGYVQERSFQLSFLRSCEYDAKRAGRSLIDHMETKRRLFGDAALGRDIRLSDLSDNDIETLSTGGIQFLRERDSAGRLVLYCHRGSLKFKERENFSRAIFYLIMVALKDESVQKLGVVVIWDMMLKYPGVHDYEADRMAIQTLCSIPIRPVARYLIYDSQLWDHVIDVLNQLITPHMRARTRSIKGQYDEVMQAMACLGIPRDAIPVNKNGEMDLTSLSQWVENRRKDESFSSYRKRQIKPCSMRHENTGSPSDVGPVKRRKTEI